ncbi:hypothetical protein FAZ69_15705 [Trinickia terrae]|uniref:Uncharacterized protein n=1 Tax=Trinickia terrae TaxID=2571161 RepID=A0A4U1I3F8_9BURK|nr:hypothetical protein [Trinickia terrae]TKC87732.1 hypothetical protein FAZ69_15705 [Trinickia terrae]
MAIIPTKADFVSATDLKFVISGRRVEDRILNNIDSLLDLFHGLESESDAGVKKAARINVLGRLYFATDRWLKIADQGSNPTVNPRRRPAVFALYKLIVDRIKSDAGVNESVMPSWLVKTFGKDMVEHGVHVDLVTDSARYLSEQEREKYKIVFKGGLAYQQKWWEDSAALILADTEIRNHNDVVNKVISNLFGGYVVSMSGDFYSGPHVPAAEKSNNGRYHSSYFSGGSVLCAGEIRIRNGVVTHINDKSGHYRPDSSNLARAVEALETQGVNIKNILVKALGYGEMMAERYLEKINERLDVYRTISHHASSAPSAISRFEHGVVMNRISHDVRKEAFEILKAHWINNGAKPPRPGHGFQARMDCYVCKDYSVYWLKMNELKTAAGGRIENIVVPEIASLLGTGPGFITRPRR